MKLNFKAVIFLPICDRK